MDTVTWSFLSGVLQILYIHVVLGNNCHTFKDRCCTHCDPGFYLTHTCGTCVQCPNGGYADKPNDRFRCKLCNRCEGPFTYRSTCTSTKDAVCTCTAGKKCTDEKCSQCTTVQCPAGQQRVGEVCMNCPPGTFNNGMELKCTSWKNCSALGYEIIAPGNLTSDAVCGSYVVKVIPSSSSSSSFTTNTITTKIGKVVRPPSEESNLQIIYIVVFSSLGLLLIAICVACRKKLTEKIKQACQKIPKPVVKQTQEEDGCSCHYPEEENGGENEPMTLEA